MPSINATYEVPDRLMAKLPKPGRILSRRHEPAYDGTVLTLEQEDISISSSGVWTSPVTGIEYPSGWTLTIPSLDLSLALKPVLVDSEFAGSRYTPAAYWEGEVRATGTRQGQAVGGRGFVELVGYDPRQLSGYSAP